MLQRTPLYDLHVAANAKLVDFSGWAMPLHYGSQREEHHRVRRAAGVFDVSHMTLIDVTGTGAQAFLRYLLANDVARLPLGKALYSCMLNEAGGILDDLIVYHLGDGEYRLVTNAATRVKDLAWITAQSANFEVSLATRDDLCMLAVQGPQARTHLLASVAPALQALLADLPAFSVRQHEQHCYATTGYTGEDGFEVMLPHAAAAQLWQTLLAAGVAPVGLGARDTLRLEAGMPLYGNDMDETTTPWESGLGWTVSRKDGNREFIGRRALAEKQAAGRQYAFVGLILTGKGVLRAGQAIRTDQTRLGVTTSGTFSPTLEKGIALARILPLHGEYCEVEIRDKWLPVRVVQLPFVRHGQPTYRPYSTSKPI